MRLKKKQNYDSFYTDIMNRMKTMYRAYNSYSYKSPEGLLSSVRKAYNFLVLHLLGSCPDSYNVAGIPMQLLQAAQEDRLGQAGDDSEAKTKAAGRRLSESLLAFKDPAQKVMLNLLQKKDLLKQLMGSFSFTENEKIGSSPSSIIKGITKNRVRRQGNGFFSYAGKKQPSEVFEGAKESRRNSHASLSFLVPHLYSMDLLLKSGMDRTLKYISIPAQSAGMEACKQYGSGFGEDRNRGVHTPGEDDSGFQLHEAARREGRRATLPEVSQVRISQATQSGYRKTFPELFGIHSAKQKYHIGDFAFNRERSSLEVLKRFISRETVEPFLGISKEIVSDSDRAKDELSKGIKSPSNLWMYQNSVRFLYGAAKSSTGAAQNPNLYSAMLQKYFVDLTMYDSASKSFIQNSLFSIKALNSGYSIRSLQDRPTNLPTAQPTCTATGLRLDPLLNGYSSMSKQLFLSEQVIANERELRPAISVENIYNNRIPATDRNSGTTFKDRGSNQVVNNTFNVTVHTRVPETGDSSMELGEKLLDILRDEARRHGIKL